MHRDPPAPDWVLLRRRVIGTQLRSARKEAHLTQQQLAERIDRDVKSISRWENGHRAPDLTDLILIAGALGVPLSDLVR
ncbi:helix-turn-helix domain-containing protein [Streptomyces ipomoeae]|uniref:helix-turn-helix domain-containing protein n=1 Tax=Streptomyces ipomoeae TaxID=103232 RepID=UPI0029B6306E|nr:helix-turn-helix transcriptional regulator [Streptomyces ipomoeae]MDX2697127.1 helix-turn-helix transcriptional regulator [Streptomyces ipomoeae]MDX2837956.1 helix-turn-helix transcriptional regulator [Streptomyces ipomoeae]